MMCSKKNLSKGKQWKINFKISTPTIRMWSDPVWEQRLIYYAP